MVGPQTSDDLAETAPGRLCDDAGKRLRAAQLSAIQRVSALAMGANLACLAIVVTALSRSAGSSRLDLTSLALWATALGGVALYGLVAALRRRGKRYPLTAHGRVEAALVIHSALLGIGWGVLPLLAFNAVDGAMQVLIAAICVGMISGGAFVLAPMPRAAICYVATLGTGAALALAIAGWPLVLYGTIALAIFCAIQIFVILKASDWFREHFQTVASLSRTNGVIHLLLKDYEENASDFLWEIDADGVLVSVPPRMAEVFGQTAARLRGQDFVSLFDQDAAPRDVETLAGAIRQRTAFRDLTVPLRVPDGADRRWLSLRARPAVSETGVILGLQGVGSDITHLKHAQDQLRRVANEDYLTGVLSRAAFHENVESLLLALPSSDYDGLCMALVDLDNFKQINDLHGHPTGDELLRQLATRFREAFAGDPRVLIARTGGDEFSIYWTLRGEERARSLDLVARILSCLDAPFQLGPGGRMVHSLSASVGVAFAPDHGTTRPDLVRNADLALYRAKDLGRNRYHVYDDDLGRVARERHRLAVDLRAAFERNELTLHFQPIVSLASNRVKAYETLLRWHDPQRRWVPPPRIIAAAEETGLIDALGDWILTRAARTATGWDEDTIVSVNLSPAQAAAGNLAERVRKILSDTGLPPHRLQLELTESSLFDSDPSIVQALTELGKTGVRLALDDFGTGYSQLSYLLRFRISTVKIDRTFIGDSLTSRECNTIVKAIVAMARALGIAITAEGVETPEQLEFVRSIGCDTVQGYLLGRPQPMPLRDSDAESA